MTDTTALIQHHPVIMSSLTKRDLSDLWLLTIVGSWKCYDLFTRGTAI